MLAVAADFEDLDLPLPLAGDLSLSLGFFRGCWSSVSFGAEAGTWFRMKVEPSLVKNGLRCLSLLALVCDVMGPVPLLQEMHMSAAASALLGVSAERLQLFPMNRLFLLLSRR